ncbi:MAG: putative transport system substrate-binding protein [Bradyrhizobium sp.]|jgi:putative ABC transport system substrate-binding protein|nr:putative transport system substrate-binding protein [Bradyrhizobium sp.]
MFGVHQQVSKVIRRLLGLAFVIAMPIPAGVAQSAPTLGYVAAKNANPKRLEVFRQGLNELGYVEGKNIRIDYREAVLDGEYQGIVAELVVKHVDIIVAANVASAVAAAETTRSTPIVMLAVNDPVGVGLVKSLEHPGTNVTGTTMYAPQLIGERLRILKQINPSLKKIAMILNGNNANNITQLELVCSEAGKLGIEIQAEDIRKPDDVKPALDKAAEYGAEGLVNAVDSFVNSQRFALAAGAADHKLIAIYSDDEYVSAGGLISLGPGHYEGYHDAAKYVDKILHGANPADLPIAGATQFTFSVNRSTMRKLGLTLPSDLNRRVNSWID